MKKKAIAYPECSRPWEPSSSASYVQDCYHIYQDRWSKGYSVVDSYYERRQVLWYSSGKRIDYCLINRLYFEGRARRILSSTYDFFAKTLINGYRRNYSFGYSRDFSGNNTSWKDTPKKQLSEKEQRRRDWREYKRIRKDKAKSDDSFGPKKHYKRLSQKTHRTWERREIHNENWERLLDYKMIKLFSDPWSWN